MFGTILLAVDGSPHADRAAELVRRLAVDGGDEVVVVHITEVMPMRGGVSVELNQDRGGMEAAKGHGRGSSGPVCRSRSSWSAPWPGGWRRSSWTPPGPTRRA